MNHGLWRKTCLAIAAGAAMLGLSTAVSASPDQGRNYYQGFSPFSAGNAVTESGRPADLVACVACHGIQGQGKNEGGLAIPSLRTTNVEFDNKALRAAVMDGKGFDGKTLVPTMPRYRLSESELSDLADYLRIIGTERDLAAGVTSSLVRVGVMLPLSGRLRPIGVNILAGITSVIELANAKGGMHGRRFELEVVDSNPDPVAAANELVGRKVYAIFGSLWQRNSKVEAIFAARHVPMIAGLTPRAARSEIGAWSFDLLPPMDMQIEALSKEVATCGDKDRRWVYQPASTNTEPVTKLQNPILNEDDAAKVFSSASESTGCLGYLFNDAGRLGGMVPANWKQKIVLPFPSALTRNTKTNLWTELGAAAANVTIELFAVSGSNLHEASLLKHINALDGFEVYPDAPVRLSEARRYFWQPDILSLGGVQTNTIFPGNKDNDLKRRLE